MFASLSIVLFAGAAFAQDGGVAIDKFMMTDDGHMVVVPSEVEANDEPTIQEMREQIVKMLKQDSNAIRLGNDKSIDHPVDVIMQQLLDEGHPVMMMKLPKEHDDEFRMMSDQPHDEPVKEIMKMLEGLKDPSSSLEPPVMLQITDTEIAAKVDENKDIPVVMQVLDSKTGAMKEVKAMLTRVDDEVERQPKKQQQFPVQQQIQVEPTPVLVEMTKTDEHGNERVEMVLMHIVEQAPLVDSTTPTPEPLVMQIVSPASNSPQASAPNHPVIRLVAQRQNSTSPQPTMSTTEKSMLMRLLEQRVEEQSNRSIQPVHRVEEQSNRFIQPVHRVEEQINRFIPSVTRPVSLFDSVTDSAQPTLPPATLLPKDAPLDILAVDIQDIGDNRAGRVLDTDQFPNTIAQTGNDLREKLIKNKASRFLQLIEEAGLYDMLSSGHDFTLFAPHDNVISTLPTFGEREKLMMAIMDHIVEGKHTTAEFRDNAIENTLVGSTLRYNIYNTEDRRYNNITIMTVNGHAIVQGNIECDNGIVHIIQSEIYPVAAGNIIETLDSYPEFSTLRQVIRAGGLEDMLRTPGPFTVLAPHNSAFKYVPLDILLENPEAAHDFVMRHLIQKTLYSSGLLHYQIENTMNGQRLNIYTSKFSGAIKINGSRVLRTDVPATNGVIHMIPYALNDF